METLRDLIQRLHLKPSSIENLCGCAVPPKMSVFVIVNTTHDTYTTFRNIEHVYPIESHEKVYEVIYE